MIRLGICNELFEGWDFARVCHTVKALGYDGLEIAPFTLAPGSPTSPLGGWRELRAIIEDSGLHTIGLHWLLAKTEGFYLTSPDANTPPTNGPLPRLPGRGDAGPGRIRDGVRLAQAARLVAGGRLPSCDGTGRPGGFLRRVCPRSARGVDLCLEPLAPSETNFLKTFAQARAIIDQENHPISSSTWT